MRLRIGFVLVALVTVIGLDPGSGSGSGIAVAAPPSAPAAGVPCVLNTVQGGPHAFESLAANTNVSRQYVEHATTWLAERLGATVSG